MLYKYTKVQGKNLKNITSNFIDTNFKYLCISKESTVLQAMKCIEHGREKLCFIVDKNSCLLRVISDGDIRRSLLKGRKLTDKVKNIHNRKPIVGKLNNLKDAFSLLTISITVIPIIDHDFRLIGVIRQRDVISNTNIRNKSIAVFGLGYVGLTLGLILAENGFSVLGVDKDKQYTKKLANKEKPFYENGLDNLMNKHIGNNLKIATSIKKYYVDIYIITVGTPINKKTSKPNISYIKTALEKVAKTLKNGDLVILRSTVPIGCTRNDVIPCLERNSNLKAGLNFSIAFCPERTSEGQALRELKELPQIVGGFDDRSRELAIRLFNEITHTVVDVASLEAAEMCKLLDNTFRDTVFAYSNQMATLAETIGLNLHELITKVNLGYKRNSIPYPSPGVGGPCLSKDPYILINNFKSLGLNSSIIESARHINEQAPALIFNKCKKILKSFKKNIKNEKIFILGLAFKGYPETSDTRGSTTIWLIDYLKIKGIKKLFVHDPIIDSKEIQNMNLNYSDINKGFKDSSLVLIMNNHPSYSNLNLNLLLKTMNTPAVFYDGWNIFSAKHFDNFPNIHFTGTGTG